MEQVALFFRDRSGLLQKLASFNADGKPPSPMYLPADAVQNGAVELVACDIVDPPSPKPPLPQDSFQGIFESFLTATVTLVVP